MQIIFINFSKFFKKKSLMNTFLLNVLPSQNPGAATVHYSLCMKKKGCLLYSTFLVYLLTMHYFISSDFLITLFGFLSSLAFNNRIENLTLITKFQGPPIFGGALRQCFLCLQVVPALTVTLAFLNFLLTVSF